MDLQLNQLVMYNAQFWRVAKGILGDEMVLEKIVLSKRQIPLPESGITLLDPNTTQAVQELLGVIDQQQRQVTRLKS